MEVIKQEIFTQTEALKTTQELFMNQKDALCQFLHQPCRNLIFLSCGSGHMLSSGAATMFSIHTEKKALAFAGGEVLMNPEKYKDIFTDSLVIVCSRSGETSEVIHSLHKLKEMTDFRVLGILAQTECTLRDYADYVIDIPWAYDNSVCQTCTISNIYYALSMLLAFYTDDTELVECFANFFEKQPAYLDSIKNECKEIAAKAWDNITVLADGEITGIASEGALAFTEICILPGEHSNVLDYRHGPIVLADKKKLIIAVLDPNEDALQKKVISELHAHGSFVITLGKYKKEFWGSDYHISLDSIPRFEVWGLPYINVCQLLAFYKAIAFGHDPDVPEGLNPYVKF